VATGRSFRLAPALAAWPGAAQRQESKEWVFLSIVMPAETAHSEGAEWGRRQHVSAPDTCGCCNPCTKHRAVRERCCAALQAESPALADRVLRAGPGGSDVLGQATEARGQKWSEFEEW